MAKPQMSKLFEGRSPSVIRMAQIRFDERTDETEALNVAIGNIQLPMYPAMTERMFNLNSDNSPFKDGVVKYSATSGTPECTAAFMNVIASSGFDTSKLHGHTTEGGTQAMELLISGICGPGGSGEKPLLLIDAAYTNYKTLCQRLDRDTCSITRLLGDDGKFSLPTMSEIEKVIVENDPGAIVVIPFDNPTGQYYDKQTMVELAQLAVKHNLWLVSDEAYRELYYTGDDNNEPCTSIWGVTEADVPGIEGRRISVETTSKVWNACGLRIGALVTDNEVFNRQAIAEHTVSLCSSVIGMHIFGAVAHEDHATLQAWYKKQRNYYREMLFSFSAGMKEALPGVVVSSPDAALYSVIDVKNLVDDNFSALDFVMWCASEGSVEVDGIPLTVLTAPMAGFYSVPDGAPNPGRTQLRVAYVVTPEDLGKIPDTFARLLKKYLDR
ncbi:MAG: aminotransferase class I/II-fold pyridoxal phosphate-dependent enzyme [bacterium]|nr:aminotransferase class I/II-fold pyridoxal phosphate-dependent enzyme [bacterium]